ncbi:bifunctional precorrin-2 dehydrogenase/sirohydrochlorin ferrochelatase [Desulfovibrio sp. OttesenSCG-928-G15]|nr:bifunctional precorrin-2 dehydrogenase/sirohydrochlorin ferrochelatase [Desulfovibrio sp. OttesenSCG-928-G15]
MAYYPLFIDAGRIDALVVGCGSVGKRKAQSLCACGVRSLVVVDPHLSEPSIDELAALGPVRCKTADFEPEDLQDRNLVYAASSSREVNSHVTRLCNELGILCNSADAPREGSFLVPAHFSSGDITVAFSTGGQSPALARVLREEVENLVGTRYAVLLQFLGVLRPVLLEQGFPSERNAEIFRAIARSRLPEMLEHNDLEGAVNLLRGLTPEVLHPQLRELLYGS